MSKCSRYTKPKMLVVDIAGITNSRWRATTMKWLFLAVVCGIDTSFFIIDSSWEHLQGHSNDVARWKSCWNNHGRSILMADDRNLNDGRRTEEGISENAPTMSKWRVSVMLG
jgi:hypothetical protein